MEKCSNKEIGRNERQNGNNNCEDARKAAESRLQSQDCVDNQRSCNNRCLKKSGTREGWKYQWRTARESLVRSVIPGPFLRPKLIRAIPYVVTSNCEDCIGKSTIPRRKLRSGIPDPWLEFLAWKEKSCQRDIRSNWEYMWLTNYLWNCRGLAMVQGIPDPWRVDCDCQCFDDIANQLDDNKRRKPKRTIRDKTRVSGALLNRDSKAKGDDDDDHGEKKKEQRNGFEKVKDKMTKLEQELRLREADEKKELRQGERVGRSKQKTVKSKSALPGKAISVEKSSKKISANASTEQRAKARVNFDHFKDQIKKCNEDILKIKKDTKLAQYKIQMLKEKDTRSSRKRDSDRYPLCIGNCGRVMKNEKVLRSIKINDDESTSMSVASVKRFLKEINNRIAITKNALNSPELKIDAMREKNKSSQNRERGAGDNPNEVIDLQPNLFTRRSEAKIPIDCEASDIPDYVDIEPTYFKQSYQESSEQNRNRAAAKESQVLVLKSFSEQDSN